MDPFALLSSGVRFDKRKQASAALPRPVNFTVAVPLPELPSDQQPARKKRKKQQEAGDANAASLSVDADAGFTLFGGGQHQQQQQKQPQQQEVELPDVHTKDPHEEANVIRKALRIKVKGSDIPAPLKHWSDLEKPFKQRHRHTPEQQQQHKPGSKASKAAAAAAAAAGADEDGHTDTLIIPHKLLSHLSEHGWHTPTPIQRQAVTALLGQRELLAVAPTGSGKTLAFLLPMIALLTRAREQGGTAWPAAPKALLLSPTHELAAQTARVLKALLPGSGLKCCLLSKKSAGVTEFSKVDVIIANPLRLKGLEEEGKVDLSKVSYLVLDEADKLLALGFAEQVDALLAAASNPHIQRALFSATLPDKVEALARSVLRDPLHVTVGERNTAQSLVAQKLMFVGRTDSGKMMALRQLLSGGGGLAADGSQVPGLLPPILVFVSTKDRAKALHRELMYEGIHVDSISGDQPNSARTAAVDNFRAGKTWVLIATDLIGRGMDFAGVNTVINYDFPATTADYIHRVGRTGRAGHSGLAITFFTEHDAPKLRSVAHLVTQAGSKVPEWMLHMTKQRDRKREQMRKRLRDGQQQQQQQQQKWQQQHMLEEPDSDDERPPVAAAAAAAVRKAGVAAGGVRGSRPRSSGSSKGGKRASAAAAAAGGKAIREPSANKGSSKGVQKLKRQGRQGRTAGQQQQQQQQQGRTKQRKKRAAA